MLAWWSTMALAGSFPPVGVAIEATDRAALDGAVAEAVARDLPALIDLYEDLHRNPELSLEEDRTAARLAKLLKRAGFQVTRAVGGTGVVGVLARGEGPTVLIRADMDALPVTEATGAPFASEHEGVMHACGHDVHMASVIGTARALGGIGDWSGTVVVILQPAEELGLGARAMIEDGLFERFPTPDVAISLHVGHHVPAGSIELTPGWANANVDMVDVRFHGRGGHGARPHQAVDPIAIGSTFVTSLQTVVSRRLDPQDPGVITVGAFHAGTKHNIIPDDAHLQLTVRSYTDGVRDQLLSGIREIAEGTCAAMGCTAPPSIEIRDEYTPAAFNHEGLTALARTTFTRVLGEGKVLEGRPTMGGEDFGRYSRALGIPGLQFRLGATAASRFDASGTPTGPLPSLHSPRFVPDPEPTVRTGTQALALLGH